MNFDDALKLAKRGRGQAEHDDALDGFVPVELPPVEEPELADDEIVPKLSAGEWLGWIDDVARVMAERSGGRWYDLSQEQRAKWRRLAEVAVVAVEEATLDRTLARLRGKMIKVEPLRDLAEREACAGIGKGALDARSRVERFAA